MSQARKALINSPETVVCEAIEGLVSATPHLARLDGFPAIKVVVDTTHEKSQVAVVSGGGSGHEPAMAGYVGAGMLAAAVCGEVFASPSEDAVLAAIRAVTGPAGCLLVVMNYTGDRLNFGAAAERAKAEGLRVELVVTADDCAIRAKLLVGRRGIAGTVLVHKVAGAAAAAGGSLQEVKAAAEAACTNIGTIGASLTECTVFGHPPTNRLGGDEYELGLGIHGEPGASRAKLRPLSGIVDEMITRIAAETDSYLPVPKGGRVVLLLNNLGSTTPLEMQAAAHAAAQLVHTQLQARVERLYCGPFMTSLDMHGLSLTLMRLPDVTPDDSPSLLAALDAPTQAPAWPSTRALYSRTKQPLPLPTGATDEPAVAAASAGASTEQGRRLRQCVAAACQALLAAKAELDALDAKTGDGDCGSTLAQGAAAIHQQLAVLPWDDPSLAALALAGALGRSMGGTSGAVYKIFLTAIGASLKLHHPGHQLTLANAAAALTDSVAAVSTYGGAQQGDRTMLDALIPASQALREAAAAGRPAPQAAAAAAAAAEAGAEATQGMAAAAGRSSYVPAEALAGIADPGAKAVAAWLRAAAQALKRSVGNPL